MAWWNNSAAKEYSSLTSDEGSIKHERQVIKEMKKGKRAVTRAIHEDAASIAARRKLRDTLRKTSVDLKGIRLSTGPLSQISKKIRKDSTEIARIETAIYSLLKRVETAYDSTTKTYTKGQARQKFKQIQQVAKDSDKLIKQIGVMAKKERDYEKEIKEVDNHTKDITKKIKDYTEDLRKRFNEVSKANRLDARHVRRLIRRCIQVQVHAADVAEKISSTGGVSMGKSYKGMVGMNKPSNDSVARAGFKMTASTGRR